VEGYEEVMGWVIEFPLCVFFDFCFQMIFHWHATFSAAFPSFRLCLESTMYLYCKADEEPGESM